MTSPQPPTSSSKPPPLPPRNSDAPPPSYTEATHGAMPHLAMSSKDPRSSSDQSLVPLAENAGRRRLMLLYIHGFMGDETSFRSFPAHVHNLVTVTLAETHVVHTKIYPKYRSKYSLDVARDDFSKWLSPHEDEWTDIILIGHSMGGLLAADIAIVFRHRIIGVINFDVPFLGMHPGVIKAGLGSIFKPWPEPKDNLAAEASPSTDPAPGKKPSRMSTLFNPKPSDPNYNPSFANDVQLPVRKGWENTLHWFNKHYSDGLRQATKGLVKSHLEFGGAMADYKRLKERYVRVRALEEENDEKRNSSYPGSQQVPRIRFVNYYTASTGRPKKPKSPKPSKSPSATSLTSQDGDVKPESGNGSELQKLRQDHSASNLTQSNLDVLAATRSRVSIEVQEQRGNQLVSVPHEEPLSATSPPEVTLPNPMDQTVNGPPNLPEVPPLPQPPPMVDLMEFTNKDHRRAAEREHEQALEQYQNDIRARNKIINERLRIEEEWEEQQQAKKLHVDTNVKVKKEAKGKGKAKQPQEEEEEEEVELSPTHPDYWRQKERLQRAAEQRQRDLESGKGRAPSPDSSVHSTVSTPDEQSDLENNIKALLKIDPIQPHGSADRNLSGNPSGPYSTYDFSRSAIMAQAPPDDRSSIHTYSALDSQALSPTTSMASTSFSADPANPDAKKCKKEKKPKKLRKFCMLPPKDAQGNKDPSWVRVFMPGVDEVTAHTTLFFLGEAYEMLVGDVGARIEEWVREADSMRVVRELEGMKM